MYKLVPSIVVYSIFCLCATKLLITFVSGVILIATVAALGKDIVFEVSLEDRLPVTCDTKITVLSDTSSNTLPLASSTFRPYVPVPPSPPVEEVPVLFTPKEFMRL